MNPSATLDQQPLTLGDSGGVYGGEDDIGKECEEGDEGESSASDESNERSAPPAPMNRMFKGGSNPFFQTQAAYQATRSRATRRR
jgi:hypothetical protein